jgi:uncharacterized protein YcbK (DUF882 family)
VLDVRHVGLASLVVGLALLAEASADEARPAAPASQEEPELGEVIGPPNPRPDARRSSRNRKAPGYPVPDEQLRRRLPPPPSGNVYLHHSYRNESLKVNIYNRDGSYNVDALAALSHLLRCRRTDTEIAMEPRLFAILSHVYDHFGERRIEITSGYRNQRRTTSNHYRGSATDIHVPGIPPRQLRAFVETLDAGGMGVGIYPRSGFLHIDVRPPPSYRWIDHSPVDRRDPNRRPPPLWKRKTARQS